MLSSSVAESVSSSGRSESSAAGVGAGERSCDTPTVTAIAAAAANPGFARALRFYEIGLRLAVTRAEQRESTGA